MKPRSHFLLVISIITMNLIKSKANEKFYNILAIDGGGLRGIISAQCINEMENYAWKYSQ